MAIAESLSPHTEEEHAYHPKQSLSNAAIVGLQAGGVGVFVSAVQNALGQHGKGAMGIFTRTGGTIGFFGTSLQVHDVL